MKFKILLLALLFPATVWAKKVQMAHHDVANDYVTSSPEEIADLERGRLPYRMRGHETPIHPSDVKKPISPSQVPRGGIIVEELYSTGGFRAFIHMRPANPKAIHYSIVVETTTDRATIYLGTSSVVEFTREWAESLWQPAPIQETKKKEKK